MVFWVESTGSEASALRHFEHGRGKGCPSKQKKGDILPWSPLPLPHTVWWVGRCFVVCSPHSSLSGCHEWMSLRCWIPGSAANSVPIKRPVLVTWHGHTDAKSDQQLWVVYPTQTCLSQSTNAAHHWHCSFGVATHGFHKHWDVYRVRPTTKCDECFGLL